MTLDDLAVRLREFAEARVKLGEGERRWDVEAYRGPARKAPPLS